VGKKFFGGYDGDQNIAVYVASGDVSYAPLAGLGIIGFDFTPV